MKKISIILIVALLFTGLSFISLANKAEACGYAFGGGCNNSYYYNYRPSYNYYNRNSYRYNNYRRYNTNTAFNNYGNYYSKNSYCYSWWRC